MTILPPSGMASLALMTMLRIAVFKLAGVRLDQLCLLRQANVHIDTRSDRRFDDLAQASQSDAHVEHFRLQGLPAGEGQELAGQGRGPVGRLHDGLDVPFAFVLGQIRPFAAGQRRRGSPSAGC